MLIAHASGASGVRLKPIDLIRYACADNFSLTFDCCKVLKMTLAWGSSLSHRFNGKSGSAPARMEIKCPYNFNFNLHLGNVAVIAVGRHESKLACAADEVLHGIRDLVI